MANLYKEYVTALNLSYTLSGWELDDAQIDINAAWVFWGMPDDHKAIQRSLWAMQHIVDAGLMMLGQGDAPANRNYLNMALQQAWEYTTEEMPEPEITAKAICEAWGANDFADRDITIAFIDRMRQLLWDEPYNVLWAAKPEEAEF